jgi:NAD(P)-dependent dehydrogenase (short-subunit alcohol dehydrogenase family)
MANTQKTAIVIGASQGIGAGLVEAFLKRGYNVDAEDHHHRNLSGDALGSARSHFYSS